MTAQYLYIPQFYALQTSATTPGSNLYNHSWRGPAQSTSTPIDYAGQLDAAYVLNGALGFALAGRGDYTT